MTVAAGKPAVTTPILLFNGECAVCRRIAAWVRTSSQRGAGAARIAEQPIGDDPAALRELNPDLDIWDAYETIHIVMPDGSMKTGGEAVAEVLRRLPNCRWFSWTFGVKIFGLRPFQILLNCGYVILADARPILGCESCGIPSPWVKSAGAILRRLQGKPLPKPRHGASPHFTAPPAFRSN